MPRFTFAALVLFYPAALLTAQSTGPARFEVAAVRLDPKQGSGAPRRIGVDISIPPLTVLPGGRVEIYGHTLRNIIAVAYDLNMLYQRIESEQEDLLESEFSIEAKAAATALTTAEAKAMVRTLLEERFQLRWRLHPREVEGYAMVPAREDRRPGPALRPFTGDCQQRAANVRVRFDSPEYDEQAPCNWVGVNGRQRAIGVSTAAIAERLTTLMTTPVSDRTEWSGLFSFDVLADTGDMPFMALMGRPNAGTLGARVAVDAPYLLDVFRRELGLKLEKAPATVNDFIIERLEPPAEN
jgi:uncharacterized protein (TIGR03435 family)